MVFQRLLAHQRIAYQVRTNEAQRLWRQQLHLLVDQATVGPLVVGMGGQRLDDAAGKHSGGHAVAGKTDAVADGLVMVEVAEVGQALHGPVNRPGPTADHRYILQLRVQAAQFGSDLVGGRRGFFIQVANAPGIGELAQRLAEHHAPVRGVAPVVEHGARVGHAFAAAETDGVELGLDRRGGDHVAGHDRDHPAQLGELRAPGVERQHHVVGLYMAFGGVHHRVLAALQVSERRFLENLHAQFQCHAAQAAGQHGGLHSGRVGVEDATQHQWRADAPANGLAVQFLERVYVEFLQAVGEHAPGVHLPLVGGRPQPAVLAVLGVDAVLLAEAADLVDGRLGGFADAPRFDITADVAHRQVLAPPVGGHATVAPAGTRAAAVALDDDDGFFRVRLFQADGRPQAKEATADDAHVGLNRVLQGRGQVVVQVKRLGIPESTVHEGCL